MRSAVQARLSLQKAPYLRGFFVNLETYWKRGGVCRVFNFTFSINTSMPSRATNISENQKDITIGAEKCADLATFHFIWPVIIILMIYRSLAFWRFLRQLKIRFPSDKNQKFSVILLRINERSHLLPDSHHI